MGKQIKNWTPPDDAVETQPVETPVIKFTPPPDAVETQVKKKVEKQVPSEFTTPSTSGSSTPAAPSEENGVKITATSRLQERISNYKSVSKTAFEEEAKAITDQYGEKLRSEIQPIFNNWMTSRKSELEKSIKTQEQADAANATFKKEQEEKWNQLSVEFSPKYQSEVNSKIKDIEGKYNAEADKWMGIYTDQFQKEDFEENKEINPLKSLAKNAWSTLSKDLPAQAYGARSLLNTAFKKMDQTILEGAENIMENIGLIEKKDRTIDQSGENKIIIDDIKKSIELSKAGAEQKKYLVNTLDKVKNGDFVDWMNYAGAAVGQGVGQIPASLATKGASSLAQQMGSIYVDSVQKIADEEGISIDEVIKQGKDDAVYPLIFGIGTGLLDAIGAKGVASGFSKSDILGSFRERALSIASAGAKSAGIETGTEAAQTSLEQIGVGKAQGKSWRDTLKGFKWDNVIESALQGGIAGLFLGGGGKTIQAITSERPDTESLQIQPIKIETLDEVVAGKNPIAAADQQAEIIDQNLNQDTNAVQQQVSDSLPMGSAAGGSQEVASGTSEPRPEEIAGEENSTQKILDEQQGMEGVSSDAGVSEKTEGTTGEGETVLPEPVQQGAVEEPSGSVVEGDVSDQTQQGTYSGIDGSREQSTSDIQPEPNSSGLSEVSQEEVKPQTPISDDTPPSTPPGEQPAGAGKPPPTSTAPSAEPDKPSRGDEGGRTYAIADRIEKSDANPAIKKGIKEKGDSYIPKGIDITDSEAKNLIELYGEEKSESLIRDTKNDLTGDTRTALAARLYENYKRKGDEASALAEKQHYYDRAVDIALTSAEQLKEAGRQTNAAKIWKSITQSEDMVVLAIEKEKQRQGQTALSTIYKQVKRTKVQMDEQIERIISQRVQEGVESRLKRAKLITEDQKKKITSALDSLKIKDIKGAANDITRVLGAAVWNGSIEAVKKAILTGADVANAVQAGVDYVRKNFKGQWEEQQYRDAVTPSVDQMVPKIDASEIDVDKVETPRLSGKKKRDFINSVVDAYNEGKLTDDKFDQLYAKQLGVREFTAEERSQIRELARTVVEVEKFEQQVKDDFTKDNIAKYKDLLAKAQKANIKLQTYAQQPNNIWDTLISIMQGNLLTPLSLVTNIYSNTALQPLRFLSTGIGSMVDYSVSQIAKTGLLAQSYQDRTIDLPELQRGYFKGNWSGLVEGLKQMKTGPMPDERSIRDLNNAFSPVRAVARWADGNRPVAQKINDYVEGTLGWSAETFFRLLNLGDKPFRRAAEMARAMEIAKQKGLKGQEAEQFLMFPDEQSAQQIKEAGDDATFQQENDVSKGVQKVVNWIINGIGDAPVVGGPLKVIAKSQLPYVKTPWNIMVETLKYAAFPVTGMVGIHQIAKGNKRAGSVLVGQAIVGAMIFTVAKALFDKGLLSWDEPYKKEGGKQRERRQIQYDNIPPNSLNVSAIQRGLNPLVEDGWAIQDDDTWIDYNKLGVMGLLFDNYSNNYFSHIKEENRQPKEISFFEDLITVAPRVASQSLDQSFLKGTNSLLTAIQDGGGYETQQWIINTTGALTAIIYPNTLTTISKSSDEFIRDTRDEKFGERMKNTFKTKFFIGEQLPPKVNLWGEKITGNPEGRDKYAFYLWDPTKFKNVDTEGWKYKLYQAWKSSDFEDDYLPSIPKREITYRKVKIKLNAAQYERLATYVGEQRKNMASTYINSAAFDRKDKEKVIKKLKDVYQEGSERGKKQFLRDMGWNILTPEKLSKINQ